MGQTNARVKFYKGSKYLDFDYIRVNDKTDEDKDPNYEVNNVLADKLPKTKGISGCNRVEVYYIHPNNTFTMDTIEISKDYDKYRFTKVNSTFVTKDQVFA